MTYGNTFKGGYQTVEIKSGVAGMYAKLKSAYEAKLPILVLKDGVRTFGNVTKDGSDYVANYIIDDVLHKDTISFLDIITDSSVDIGVAGEDIAALEERVDANTILAPTDIKSYDGSTEELIFTAPSDGYIRVGYTAGTGTATLSMKDKLGQWREPLTVTSAGSTSLFVKKGMRFGLTYSDTIAAGIGYFYGFE